MVAALVDQGVDVVVVDNLSTGLAENVRGRNYACSMLLISTA
ncbi:MAG: hypothetical protein IPK27_04110 [Rhodanobacteraceae bacterium]|nr:hypothetical protein [Rhodanobacteraceae bacterium]